MLLCYVKSCSQTSAQGTSDMYVIKGGGPPTYWYSLDLVTAGPRSITKPLVEKIDQLAPPMTQKQTPENMRCTMYYRHAPGPDREYEKQFFKEKHQSLKLTTLY